MSDRPTPVGSLLPATSPDRVPEVAAEYLRQSCGAYHVELLIADLTSTSLVALIEPDGPAGDTLEMRCFRSQDRIIEPGNLTTRVLLPMTAWGNRIGVLRVDLPEPVDDKITDQLDEVSSQVALALRAAGKDTDRYHRAQRSQRLTMAAELQWDLLPGRSLAGDRFRLAGALEPAYAMYGDHYDWSISGDQLTITVLNGHGDGMAAALLTAVAVNAMRNARRSGAGLVEQAELASDAIYSQYGGTQHVATLLLQADLSSGEMAVVDAGSPRALLTRRGDVRMAQLDQQLPLGMFDDSRYEAQHLPLIPGTRLVLVSDGVHGAAPGGRSPYGDSALPRTLRRTLLQPPAEAVGTVLRELREYHAGVDAEDDAVVVCLDWFG